MAVSIVKIAESAWDGIIQTEQAELPRRQLAPAHDESAEAWRVASKRHFLAAWRHVSAMLSSDAIRSEYATYLTSPDPATVKRALEALNVDVRGIIESIRSKEAALQFKEAVQGVEGVLVACLGHYSAKIRGAAVRLLNALYDATEWQLSEPLQASIKYVNQPLDIVVFTNYTLLKEDGNNEEFRVLLSAPSFDRTSGADQVITLHVPTVTTEDVWTTVPLGSGESSEETFVKTTATKLSLSLKPFPRCGYYDWRVVVVGSDGQVKPISMISPLSQEEVNACMAAGLLPGVSGMASPKADRPVQVAPEGAAPKAASLAQGRFIVHKEGILNDTFQEVIVDLDGMKFSESGDIVKHGTFQDVTRRIRDLRGEGVTSLFVLGAIERDNGWGETEAASAQETKAIDGVYVLLEPSSASQNDSGSESGFGYYTSDDGQKKPALLQPGGMLHLAHNIMGSNNAVRAPAASSDGAGDQIPAGLRAYATRPDANPHAVVDRHTPNRMLGGSLGLFHMVKEAQSNGISILLQCDASVSASRPHRKYRHLYARTLDMKGQAMTHAGTDALENQWEDMHLLNYRKVETWDLLVSEMKTLVQNFEIGGIYLSEAQSYPFIMSLDLGELFRRDVDGEGHYTPREVLEGEVVIANTEFGYWGTKAARYYPNPLLVKLTKSLWAIAPDFIVAGECHWGRAASLLRSGVVPRTLDLLSAMTATLGRFVDKNGQILSITLPHDVGAVHLLKALIAGEADGILPPQAAPQYIRTLQTTGAFPSPLKSLIAGPAGSMPAGGQQLQLRSICSARLPYPALVLGRSAWTGVDCMFALPGIPMLFQDEKLGRAYRVDVTGTYAYNEKYLEEEKKKREKRAVAEKHTLKQRSMNMPTTKHSHSASASGSTDMHLPSIAPPPTSAAFQAPPDEDIHIGVGGVIPAMPLRDMAQPSYKFARTGFSSVNLVDLAAADLRDTEDGPPSTAHTPPSTTSHPPPHPSSSHQAWGASGGPPTINPVVLRSSASRMIGSSSSPALSSLLLAESASNDGIYSPYTAEKDTTPTSLSSRPPVADNDEEEPVKGNDKIKLGQGFGFYKQLKGTKSLGNTVTVEDSTAGSVSRSELTKVTSWAALDAMTFKGDVHHLHAHLRDNLRHIAAMEARLRTEVGPEYGFDLQHIRGHYEHRRLIKARYPVLREGDLTVLTAQHRFGEHAHVFSFARSMPGNVAVVAANFNGHSSTFAVDCSPLIHAFGAATASDASASVAQLMGTSVKLGDLVRAGRFSELSSMSLNLKGGVWEVRDVFASNPLLRRAETSGSSFTDDDGPFVGILTSEEAAHAPMLATLAPHRSFCWLFCAAPGAASAAAETDVSASSLLNKQAETDPAAMQWLFASSLLRLQQVLRLKEVGLSSCIITKSEVTSSASGGDYETLLETRRGNSREPWINPGDALKDQEIQAAARHNLVYSLLRHVVKKASTTYANNPEQVAVLMEAAIRVLVTHWQIQQKPSSRKQTGGSLLIAAPLPSLHGAMNRDAAGESPMASAAGQQWYGIDAEAAIVVARAALFLAVKDVNEQSAGARTSSDVSDKDSELSALIVRALHRVARSNASSDLPATEPAAQVEKAVAAFAQKLLHTNDISPIVFVTPELGKWSTVGGLGVMVDELSVGLAELGAEVICISPYYHVNRKGVTDYLRTDGITYTGRTIGVDVGRERIEMGVHEGRVKDVRLFFLHNASVFPRPYPDLDAAGQVRVLTAFSKATLELLCQWRLIPKLIVTNDWFTGLVPAYARHGRFGDVFNRTDFMHIAHNLNPDYEGRLWPDRSQGTLDYIHGLPSHLLVDHTWADVVINPTRAALLSSDTWATVSRSYRQDLLRDSPQSALLKLAPHPFAHPNGIPVKARLARIQSLPFPTHEAAKEALQKKYFGFAHGDPTIPLFAFVGRITMQKGVHLILQTVNELLRMYNNNVMFLVGGMASAGDTYGNNCAGTMRALHAHNKARFWANPDLFFTDGDLVNLGADFCLMPSMFEPGGIVQQEFFVAGTPVIAFKTGGLKDTVIEFDPAKETGNGFTFEGYRPGDLIMACQRAINVFHSPQYAKLRQNARDSVMDLDVVSKGWFREFHRLRRCLPPPARRVARDTSVMFTVDVGDIPGLAASSVVEVTGSFSNWTKTFRAALVGSRQFQATLQLPPGTFQYKFIVDGMWSTNPKQPVADDGTGNLNNVITVLPPPAELVD